MHSPPPVSRHGMRMPICARLASTASAYAPTRRLQTAIAWRSTGRCCSIRRSGGASAQQSDDESGAARLLAPLGDGFLCARELACALVVVQEHALASRIHGADP